MGESVQDTQTMYREEEKLCLKWNDFQENAISAFGTLREDREFADVTLACEDGQQVEAHKVILASSSPFFLNLLKRNKHPHPLIYMKGLKSEDLVAMVDFLYFGEANVYQENLDFFLAVAQEFQLKGLTGSEADKKVEKASEKLSPKNKSPKPLKKGIAHQEEVTIPDLPTYFKEENKSSHTMAESVAVTEFSANLQDMDEKINSMMETSENTFWGNGKTRKMKKCKVCGKEGQKVNIMNHIEANHITGVSHTCNICGKVRTTKNGLNVHKSKEHRKKT